jgi:hypothetical protein
VAVRREPAARLLMENFGGYTLPGIEIIDRSSVNAFDDARVTRAIEATGRQEADLRRHLARDSRGVSCHHSQWQRI